MRVREGAVVLVPDQIVRGPARVLAPESVERLPELPARLRSQTAAPLQASELLVACDLPPGAGVIPATADDNGAVIASVAHGGGRLLVSGALDAWRFRALDDAAFDRLAIGDCRRRARLAAGRRRCGRAADAAAARGGGRRRARAVAAARERQRGG